MDTHTVICPKCQTALKANKPIRPGKNLTCPRCKTAFAAPAPEEFTEAKTLSMPVPKEILNLQIPDRDDEEPARPSRRREEDDEPDPRRPAPSSKTPIGLIVFGVLAIVMLLITCAVLAYFASSF